MGCRYRKADTNSNKAWADNLRTTEVKTEYYKNREEEKNRNVSSTKENSYPKYFQKYETKYPQNLLETEESPKSNESLKYILKPILYSRIDEYFVENEKADAMKRLQRHQDARAKAEIIKNFQELYESHCRLIEAQNIFIHEHMELVKARQLLQVNSEKARWMENHAEIFSSQQKLTSRAQLLKHHKKVEAQVLKQHKKVDTHVVQPAVLTFKQYVSSL